MSMEGHKELHFCLYVMAVNNVISCCLTVSDVHGVLSLILHYALRIVNIFNASLFMVCIAELVRLFFYLHMENNN